MPLACHLIIGISAKAKARAKIECGDIGFTSSQEDCEIAKDSQKINSEKCPPEEADTSVRDKLEGALHGENLLQKRLEESKDEKEFEDSWNGVESHFLGFSVMWPMVIVIGMFIWWFLGCCAMCPCCRCCRCCKKERGEVNKIWKGVYFALLLACLIGIISGMSLATGGAKWISEGWDTIQCTLTTLVRTVVSGTDPTWPTEKVNGLVDKLGAEEPFMVTTREILLRTEPVERAVKMLTGTLTLLDTVMSKPDNIRPKSNSGQDLNHICHLCQGVAGKISPVAESIDSSLGKALQDARGEVNEKLSGKELLDLQDTLRDGVDPMNEVRDDVMDGFIGKDMIKGGGFKTVEDYLALISTVVLLVSILALLPFVCGCCALGLTAFKPLHSNPRDNGNIYRSSPHRCACCSWCCGICFASLHLFLAFIFTAVTIPLSSVCIVLDDLKGDTFDKWAPAMGVDKEKQKPEDWQNTLNVVDACTNRNSDGRILNVLTVEDKKSDEGRITIRDKLIVETRDKIDEQFDKIKDKQTTETLLENQDFKEMFKLLEMPVDSLISFDPARIGTLQTRPEYAGFVMKPDLGLKAFATSAGCDSYSVDKNGPMKDTAVGGQTVPGIQSLRDDLDKEGLSPKYCPGSGCTCSVSGGNAAVETAANSILTTKNMLRSSRKFRCDLLVNDQGNSCDPKVFKRGGLMPDCVKTDKGGKMSTEIKPVDCSFTEFVQYVKDFKDRLEVAVSYLEDEAKELLPAISEDLKAHIDKELLDVMVDIADGVTCDPFKNVFHGSIDGICYHAVRGLIDIAEGLKVLGMFVVVLCCFMYFLWRRGYDNISERKYKVAHGIEDGQDSGGRAGGPQQAGRGGDNPNQVDVR